MSLAEVPLDQPSLAERISEIPQAFERRDVSTATLLKESGYLESSGELKVADVEEVLSQDPELADRWWLRGHDQQLVGGWGLDRCENRYRVQSYGTGRHMLENDRLHATAEFIVRYVGFMGDVLHRHP